MGKAAKQNQIKLECTECHNINYFTRKNKKLLKDRLVMKKFCNRCDKHTEHKETK